MNVQAATKRMNPTAMGSQNSGTSSRKGPAKTGHSDSGDLYAPSVSKSYDLVLYLLVAVVLFVGWGLRGREYMTPEYGPGYILGVIGLALMVLLLLYPVRKKAHFMRNMGSTKIWFGAHMVMGVLGPVLVLFHANFQTGSLNSAVALLCTLLVAVSGLVGRYFYRKVHYGLYGRQMTLRELKVEIETRMSGVTQVLDYAPKLQERLLAFDAEVLRPCHSFFQSLWRCLKMGLKTRWTHLVLVVGLSRALKVTARRSGWSSNESTRRKVEACHHISAHMTSALRIVEFQAYERLFALWHMFHFPLFFLLVIVSGLHVVAVHLY